MFLVWAGFAYFQQLFASRDFLLAVKNTIVINIYHLVFGFPAPIILALMLNEVRSIKFKRITQTLVYLPHFVSWVVIGSIMKNFMSVQGGLFNEVLGIFGAEPIGFLAKPQLFRGILVISGIWKEVGWGTIIYLATMAGIDPQLYEAAIIDGANRWHQALRITLPSIASVVVILFILRVGRMMDAGFEEIFNLYNPVVYEVADIIDTYVYRVGLEQFDYSFSTAIGLFKNLVGLILLVFTNLVTKRISEYGIW